MKVDANFESIAKIRWESFIEHIKSQISEVEFNSWFSNLSLKECRGKTIVINSPLFWAIDYIKEGFHDEINKFLKCNEESVHVAFDFEGEITTIKTPSQKNKIISKHKNNPTLELCNRHSFNDFFSGPENKVSVDVLKKISSVKIQEFTITIITGNNGVGKTHIANAMLKESEFSTNLKTTTLNLSELNDIMSANNSRTISQSINAYTSLYSMIVLDNFQEISKNNSYAESFSTFIRHISNCNLHIVLVSDVSLKDLQIPKALKSRLHSGTIWNINKPKKETLVKIISHYSELMGINIDPKHKSIMAKSCNGDVREILGMIKTSKMLDMDLDEENDAYKSFISTLSLRGTSNQNEKKNTKDAIDVLVITKVISKHYGIPLQSLMSSSSHTASHTRGIAMYLDKELNPSKTTKQIGEFFKKSHPTVVKSINKISALVQNQPALRARINLIKNEL